MMWSDKDSQRENIILEIVIWMLIIGLVYMLTKTSF